MLRFIAQPRSVSKAVSRTPVAHRIAAGDKQAVAASKHSSSRAFVSSRSLLSFSSVLDTSDNSELTCHMAALPESKHSNQISNRQEAMKKFVSALQVTFSLASPEFSDPWCTKLPLNELERVMKTRVPMRTGVRDEIRAQPRNGMDTCRQLSVNVLEDEEITVSRFRELEEHNHEKRHTEANRQEAQSIAKHSLETDIARELRSRSTSRVVTFFNKSVEKNVKLSSKTLLELFRFLLWRDVVHAHKVMRRYRVLEKSPMEPRMYARLCDAIGTQRAKSVFLRDLRNLVRKLRDELKDLDVKNYQHLCYPRLIESLVKQRDAYLGRAAMAFYQDMVEGDFPKREKSWERCIEWSRYARQNDLPYHDMLREIVASGRRPYPPHAVQVLLNLFPFTDLKATSVALQAVLELQLSAKPSDQFQVYHVDTGTLEQITAAGARKGSPDLNIMVWDMLEAVGCKPTEAMYENTIQAFCMSYREDHSVFAVLAEMESSGFKPTRALIRSISRSLRFSPGRTDHAYYLLRNEENESASVSVASLNTVLSACAEMGDVDRSFSTFNDFEVLGLDPDADSFSFLIEALGKNVQNETSSGGERRTDKVLENVDVAESVLEMMSESFGLPLCSHSLHGYVQLLCFAGDTSKAIEVVNGAFEAGHRVTNKTLYILAKECCDTGEIALARDIASKTSEPWHFLEERIRRWEADFRRGQTP